ncbi:MAG: threonine--tRNA ligase [archaeon]
MPHIVIVDGMGKGKQVESVPGATLLDVAKEVLGDEYKKAVAAKMADKVVDLSTPVTNDADIRFYSFEDPEGIEVFRHSSTHLMAHAVVSLYHESQPTIGPVVDEGFYYDFHRETPFNPEDLKAIEKKMDELRKENLIVTREDISKEEAKKLFSGNKYKVEMIEELPDDTVSVYRQGDFVDLCRGPHVPSTGYLKAFKLTKVAGAYWRADAKNEQLQRLYGISFPQRDQLKEYVHLIEEAEKRNHRRLGKDLGLFDVFDEAPGMPFFFPNGTIIWNQVEGLVRELLLKGDYVEVKTPIIMRKDLWLQSGHWDHYKENMYFVNVDNEEFAIKPMNCPGHVLIYKSQVRSYRELPLRMAEFGMVHRHELSGVLHGLMRVRKFTQDDAHIFCMPEQLEDEIIGCIRFVDDLYSAFGFTYSVELSTKPEKAMGSQEIWDSAEKALKNALSLEKIDFKINEGDGAFYGPKIDFHIRDALGRTWQCATIQVDFSMPERFDMNYMGEDGQNNHRPVMVHRAIVGSMERFIGILIEHFGGKFPIWLAPVQARLLTVSQDHVGFAQELEAQFKNKGLRAEIDLRPESVPKKVRTAQLDKVPAIIIIGDKEKEAKTVSVRTLDGEVVFGMPVDDFLIQTKDMIEKRSLDTSYATPSKP